MSVKAPIPLTTDALEPLLDELLQTRFSSRSSAQALENLRGQPRHTQDFLLAWMTRLGGVHPELAARLGEHGPAAYERMGPAVFEAWMASSLDAYDREGLRSAAEVITQAEDFIRRASHAESAAILDEHIGVLRHFVHGLAGRPLDIRKAEHAYTDTETIFLPTVLGDLSAPEDNFQLYKATVTFLWAQNRFGSLRCDLNALLSEHPRPQAFEALFRSMDTIRIEACLQREMPGLHRDMQRMKQALGQGGHGAEWDGMVETLTDPSMTIHEVCDLVEAHLDDLEPLPPLCFQGELRPQEVSERVRERLLREEARFRSALRSWADEVQGQNVQQVPAQQGDEIKKVGDPDSAEVPQGEGGHAPNLKVEGMEQDTMTGRLHVEMSLDGDLLVPPEAVQTLAESIAQDLGEIPEEYLIPAAPGEYETGLSGGNEDPGANAQGGEAEDVMLMPEWDYQRQSYRKDWCAVREQDVDPVRDDFVARTLHKHKALVAHLRKVFEAIRDEDRLLRCQPDGENIDLDALIEGMADVNAGMEMSENLFTRLHRSERNIAVLFLVDMSGSTEGWINDAERESLVLLSEALETLGDRYAIYGFSGNTRKRCDVYRIKRFDEPVSDEVRGRISGIAPKQYTRMGSALRYLNQVLMDTEAKTRLLITLSDGKPDDFDGYRGQYGIEDTRRALIEARRSGTHPYCITIDQEGKDYLPHLYGPAAFTVVSEVRQLPLKVSDIYQQLTT